MPSGPTSDFPLGVKTTYRAYSSDEVFEIVDDVQSPIGYSYRNCKVTTQPAAQPQQSSTEENVLFYLTSQFHSSSTS